MSRNLTFKVTQDHIDRGIPIKSKHCPLALAIQEATGQYDVSVGGWTLTLDNTTYYVPNNMRDWVLDFDLGRPVKPRTFNVSLKEAKSSMKTMMAGYYDGI